MTVAIDQCVDEALARLLVRPDSQPAYRYDWPDEILDSLQELICGEDFLVRLQRLRRIRRQAFELSQRRMEFSPRFCPNKGTSVLISFACRGHCDGDQLIIRLDVEHPLVTYASLSDEAKQAYNRTPILRHRSLSIA